MLKKLFFLGIVLFSLSIQTFGQCLPPTNVVAVSDSMEFQTIGWDSPIDSFYVEFGPEGFIQGTGGYHVVYDTLFTFPYYMPCQTIDVYIARVCNGGLSQMQGPISFSLPPSKYIWPLRVIANWTTTFHLSTRLCGDSLWPSQNGLSFYPLYANDPPDVPSSFAKPRNFAGHALYADGDLDTILSYATPFCESTGANFACFFSYSNNVANPGDNVSLSVHLSDGDTTIYDIFNYSGDEINWKKNLIDLQPYQSSIGSKLRLIFEIDQTTSNNPKWNDVLVSNLMIGDTSTCSKQYLASFSRPSPTSINIARTVNPAYTPHAEYQYGPVGFTPNNGQFGTVKSTSHNVSITNVNQITDWVYVKDSCMSQLNPHAFSKWEGPYHVDSSYTKTLYGYVYLDTNNNCTYDNELIQPYSNVYSYNTSSNNWANSSGFFSITTADTGMQKIVTGSNSSLCNSSIEYLADTILNDTIMLASSTLQRKDYKVLPHPWGSTNFATLQGDTNELRFNVINISPQISLDSFTIFMEFDTTTMEIIDNGFMTYDSISNLYTARIGSLPSLCMIYMSSGSIYSLIQYTLPKFRAKIGAAYLNKNNYVNVYIDSLNFNEVGPNTLQNNSVIFNLKNVAAIDPNDKHVSPEKYTTIQTDRLDYRIRFQNTGNHPATTVVVVDSLPFSITRDNFMLNQTSHSCQTNIDSNNVATFTFHNIQLPDSTTDPEGSQGYIDFSFFLDTPMQIGDSIANRAHIFFDYQPAVITNYAWVKVIDSCDLILPMANFTNNSNSLTSQGDTVTFTSTALNAKNINWYFGDGQTATGPVTSHDYTSPGNYIAKQVVANSCGILDSTMQQIIISDTCDLIQPLAGFSSILSILTFTGFTVDFNSTATNATSVYWDFGDGNQDSGIFVSHTYTTNGTYNVKQTIFNNCNQVDSLSKQIDVYSIGNPELENGGLKVFPNPAKNKVKIECTSKSEIQVKLLDVTGKLVLENTMQGGQHNLDVSELVSGSYVLQLYTSTGEVVGQEKVQIAK